MILNSLSKSLLVAALCGCALLSSTGCGGEGTKLANDITNSLRANITGVAPASGAVGTTVVITGTKLGPLAGGVPDAVAFNGVNATNITFISDTTISCVVPVGATTGPVVVFNGSSVNGVPIGSNELTFTVTP
jgi:hypothetical protein